MKITRAIITGLIIWILIFLAFTLMSFVPEIKDSLLQQNIVVYILLVPFVYLAIKFYQKKAILENVFVIGLTVVLTSLILDAIITVPMVILPQGGTYLQFYTDPMLWIMIAEIMLLFFLFSKYKFQKEVN